MLTSKGIIEKVALKSKIELERFTKSGRGDKYISRVRGLTFYLLRKYKKLSYPNIAYLFGQREHTGVMRLIQRVRNDQLMLADAEELWKAINKDEPFRGKSKYLEAYNFVYFLAKEYGVGYENILRYKVPLLVSVHVLHKKMKLSVIEIISVLEVSELFLRARIYCLGEDITRKGDLFYEKFLKNWEIRDYWEKFIPNYKTSKVEVRRCYFF